MTNNDIKKLTIYITKDAHDKLRKKGYKDNIKHTEIIRQAIDDYLNEHAKKT